MLNVAALQHRGCWWRRLHSSLVPRDTYSFIASSSTRAINTRTCAAPIVPPADTRADAISRVRNREDLMGLKVVELQAELQKLNLPKTGKKEVLVHRLYSELEKRGLLIEQPGPTASQGHDAAPAKAPKKHAQTSNGRKRNSSSNQQQHGATPSSDPCSTPSNSMQAPTADISSEPTPETHRSRTRQGRANHDAAPSMATPPTDTADAPQQTSTEQPSTAHATGKHALSLSQPGILPSSGQNHAATRTAPNTPPSDTSSKDIPPPQSNKPQWAIDREAALAVAQPASTEGLPPMPNTCRGTSFGVHQMEPQLVGEELTQFLLSNPTGLMLAFLGTSSHMATQHRSLPSMALMRGKDVWLFDAGDDCQRQLSAMQHVRSSKVFRIFFTALSTDTLLGLPGLLCTISASRERGHEVADIPIHLYGPPGLADFITTMLKVSHTYLEVNIIVHEFSYGPVSVDETRPTLYNKRARIFQASMPPDQLNPEGFIDGDLTVFMPTQGRAQRTKGFNARGGVLRFDPRAGFYPFEEFSNPVRGDPDRTDVTLKDMTWTIRIDEGAKVTATALRSPKPTMAYVFQEAERQGNLVLERCEALGVVPGSSYGRLKSGVAVTNNKGELVTPEMVVTPRKPGRRVAILGTCTDVSSAFMSAAEDVDVLVYGALSPSSSATTDMADLQIGIGRQAAASGNDGQQGQHSFTSSPAILMPALTAGQLACQLNAVHTVLARFDSRLHGDAAPEQDELLQTVLADIARAGFSGAVTAVTDLWTHVLQQHQGPDPPAAAASASATTSS